MKSIALGDATIVTTLLQTPDNQTACQALVQQANQAGGRDNITVLLVEWT